MIKKITRTVMWIAAYEVWRLNIRATYKAARLIYDHKHDDNTWGEAINDARDHVRQEASNGDF